MNGLMKYLKRHRLLLLLLLAAVLIQSWGNLALPNKMSDIVNTGIQAHGIQTDYIIKEGLKMLLLTVAVVLFTVATIWLSARIAAGVGRDMRRDLFLKSTRMSDREYEQFGTASLITRTTNDVQQIQDALVILLRIVLSSPLMGIGAIVMALRINATMSWILLGSLLLIALTILFLYRFLVPRFTLLQRLTDRMNRVLRETLGGFLTVRAFNAQAHEAEKFDEVNRKLTGNMLFVGRIGSVLMPVMMLILNLTHLSIVFFGARQVALGRLAVGNIMAFIQYATLVIFQFMIIALISVMLPRAIVSAGRVEAVVRAEVSIQDPEPAGGSVKDPWRGSRTESLAAGETTSTGPDGDPDGAKKAALPGGAGGRSGEGGGLCFDRVRFRFPGAEEWVLDDISFCLKPGQTVAVIGGTGSGKSTLCRLIPRFYDVNEGSIRLADRDLRTYRLADLRDRIGYIPQQALLFSGTIRDNLTLGKNKSRSDEDLQKALRIAMAEAVAAPEEGGLDRQIARGGSNLSGGQRQRLCIARALLSEPDYLIFDDSFSALDYQTDAALRHNLKTEITGVGFLIIAQRVSTVMQADEIILLHEGRIAARGRHEDLLETSNVYREIAASQGILTGAGSPAGKGGQV